MSVEFYLSKIFVDVLKWVLITSDKTRVGETLKKIELLKKKFLEPPKIIRDLTPDEEILVAKVVALVHSDVEMLRATTQRTSYLKFLPALPDSGDIRCHITHRASSENVKIRWTGSSDLTIMLGD